MLRLEIATTAELMAHPLYSNRRLVQNRNQRDFFLIRQFNSPGLKS